MIVDILWEVAWANLPSPAAFTVLGMQPLAKECPVDDDDDAEGGRLQTRLQRAQRPGAGRSTYPPLPLGFMHLTTV